MEYFSKTVNSLILSTKLAKGSILDVLLGSEYASDYLGGFSFSMNWNCQSDSSKNLFSFMSILFNYQESYVQNLSELQTRNQNGFY